MMYFNKKTWYEAINPSLSALYDSQGEAALAYALDRCWRDGIIKGVERQVKFPFYKDGKKVCDHIVDFIVILNNGRREVREFKGNYTGNLLAKWLAKVRLWRENYPQIPYFTVKEGRRRKHQLFSLDDILGTLTITLTRPQPHQYSKWEFFLSMIIHKVAGLFIK